MRCVLVMMCRPMMTCFCGPQMSYDLHVKTHKDVTDTKEVPCSDCDAMFYLDKARDFHFNSVHSR